MKESLLSLDPNARKTPPHASFQLKKAKGGEQTYRLELPKDAPPQTLQKKARKGELLRDSDLRYQVDLRDNLVYRAKIKANCDQSDQYKQAQLRFCKDSILYFVNTFCWTYDPRLENPHVPFVTYPFQDDMITWSLWLIQNKETGLIEKSRDMGATWCMEAVGLYMCLFFTGKVDYQLSLRENDVDSRSEDSLMGKIRYMLRNLPDWMQCGWREREQGVDNKMYIQIPGQGSSITGQLTGGTSARGGRSSRAFYDEFAFIEDSDKVRKAAGSLSPACLFLSTPNGMNNAFYTMASSPFVRKQTLHWTLHPLKNKEWMKKERSKVQYTDEIWAQEHDIDYTMSTSERVYQQFKSFVADEEYDWMHIQEGEYFEYDPNLDVYCSGDLGISDASSWVFAQIKPPPPRWANYTKEMIVIFAEFERSDWTIDNWAKFLKETGYTYREIIGDYRTGNQRTPTGKTWIQYLAQHGINMVGKYNTEFAPILEVKRKLETPGAFAINKEKCPATIQAFQNWSYKINKETGIVPPGAKPRHDKYSHNQKAVAYLIDYIYGRVKHETVAREKWDFKVVSTGRYI